MFYELSSQKFIISRIEGEMAASWASEHVLLRVSMSQMVWSELVKRLCMYLVYMWKTSNASPNALHL